MRKVLIVLFLFCFAFVNFAQAQKTSSKKAKSQKTKTTKQQKQNQQEDKPNVDPLPRLENELTPEEQKEAKEFAELFIKRMRETRNLKPLIDEMFISKFKYLNEFVWATVGLPVQKVDYLNEDERLELYCNFVTIDYLSRLYAYSKMSETQIANLKDTEENNERLLPPAVIAYGKTIKLPDEKIGWRGAILFSIEQTGKQLKLWQEEAIKNPPEETAQFKTNLDMFSKHLDEKNNYWGKPYGTRLKEEQHSLPAGTKIINLEIPFHIGLLMAKEDGKMKVICVFSRVLPD